MIAPMRSPFSEKRSEPAVEEAPARRGKRSTQDMLDERKGHGLVGSLARFVVGLAIACVLLAGIFFGASALEGKDKTPVAPWAQKGAPNVTPDPLADQ